MKPFLCLIATVAIASLAPCISSAADLGDDAQQGSYVPPPQVRFVDGATMRLTTTTTLPWRRLRLPFIFLPGV